MKKAELFFTEAEKTQIIGAVRQTESKSSGEIAVLVADRSARYQEAETAMALLLSGVLSFILARLIMHGPLWSFVAVMAALFVTCKMIIASYPRMLLPFLPMREKNEAVHKRAWEVFSEQGLDKTKMATGFLFYFSLLERSVYVVADRGIYEKMGQETLDAFANIVTQGVKHNRSCDALCQAINEVGGILEQHFPINPDDTNELPDDVRPVSTR